MKPCAYPPVENRWRCLHRSNSVMIGDYHCRPHSSDCGVEEVNEWHSIAFPRRGLFVKHVNGRRVVADSNLAVFFNQGEAYRVSHPVGGDDCTTFRLDDRLLLDLLSESDPSVKDHPERPFSLTHGPTFSTDFLVHRRVLRHAMEADHEPLLLEEMVIDLVSTVVRRAYRTVSKTAAVRSSTRRAHQEWVDATKIVLARRFSESLDLHQIAESVACSSFHLARVFKAGTGVSIHHYLNRLRLREALDRLAEVDSDLTALALDVGYYDLSHFSNAFRREYGLTPSECRRSLTSRTLREMSKNLQAKLA